MFSIISTLFILYFLLFLYSLRIKDNSTVDVFWGIGFMVVAILAWYQGPRWILQHLVTTLVCIWGIRLTLHIWLRKLHEKREDPRYAKWREEWGSGWYFLVRSFLQVYILQMILLFIIATPILLVNLGYIHTPSIFLSGGEIAPWVSIYVLVAVFIALFGIIFESIADRQLGNFMKVKKPGQIFTTGLYRYTRHPNYFGESMFWLGISLLGLVSSWWALVGWGVITFLLVFVSGIPMQEARYAGRPEWEDYKKKTSAFIPWFSKSK